MGDMLVNPSELAQVLVAIAPTWTLSCKIALQLLFTVLLQTLWHRQCRQHHLTGHESQSWPDLRWAGIAFRLDLSVIT